MKSFLEKLTHEIWGIPEIANRTFLDNLLTKNVDKMYGAVSRFSLVDRCSLIDFV